VARLFSSSDRPQSTATPPGQGGVHQQAALCKTVSHSSEPAKSSACADSNGALSAAKAKLHTFPQGVINIYTSRKIPLDNQSNRE
jgi:hypothetical protein